MNFLLLNFIIALWIETMASLFFGIFMLIKGTEKSHRLFGLHSLSVCWWSFCQIWLIACNKHSTALFWGHIVIIGIVLIPTFFLHFTISFLQIKNKGWLVVLTYMASVMLILLSPTKYMVIDVVPKFYLKFYNVPGFAFHFVGFVFIVGVLYSLCKIFKEYKKSLGEKRNQLKYLLLISILGFGGGSLNFFLSYDVNIIILPFLTYIGAIYPGVATYAILRHHLMDINIVIKRTAVYSIFVALITASYFVLIYTIELIFRDFVGYKSVFLTISFLILFTLISQPLKNIIQSFVDKHFFKGSQFLLAEELKKAQEELKRSERLKAVGTLAAGMAHEIKNPLTGIKTFTEYLPNKYNDPKFIEKFYKIVSAEVDKINDIVQQLLDFSKPKPLELQKVNIHQVIDQTLSLLSNSLIKHKISLARNYDNSLSFLNIDPNQMQQVFCNLFLNAIEAMRFGGELTIATKISTECAEINISDTGKGIAKKDFEHIFDPFYTTKEHGTGLGMSIIYGIIKEHKGEIRIESGKGTKITVLIPIAK